MPLLTWLTPVEEFRQLSLTGTTDWSVHMSLFSTVDSEESVQEKNALKGLGGRCETPFDILLKVKVTSANLVIQPGGKASIDSWTWDLALF